MNQNKRILLVKPKFEYYPLGIAYVASTMERAGYEYDYVDLFYDCVELEPLLRSGKYNIVASGGLVGNYLQLEKFFRKVKGINPLLICIIGGLVVRDVGPELIFKHIPVDYAVIGEAELTLPDLLSHIYTGSPSLETMRGVAYRGSNGEVLRTPHQHRLDLLEYRPRPSTKFFDHSRWPHHNLSLPIPITTGRGCYGTCIYCSPSFRTFRPRTMEDVFADVEHQVSQWNVTRVQFLNEVLYPTVEQIINFCDEYKKRFKIPFICVLRLDIDPIVLKHLKDAGCVDINVGIETGSDSVLQSMRKGTTITQARTFVQEAKRNKLMLNSGIMFNNPGETEDDIAKTLEFDAEINIRTGFNFCIPYNGTPLFRTLLQQGSITDEYQFLREQEVMHKHSFQTDMLFLQRLNGKPLIPNATKIPDNQFVRAMRDAYIRYNARYALKNVELMAYKEKIFCRGQCPICGNVNEFPFNFDRPIQREFYCTKYLPDGQHCFNDRYFHFNIIEVTKFQGHRNAVAAALANKKRIAIASYDSYMINSVLAHNIFSFDFDNVVILVTADPDQVGTYLFNDSIGNHTQTSMFVMVNDLPKYDPDAILIADTPQNDKHFRMLFAGAGISTDMVFSLYPDLEDLLSSLPSVVFSLPDKAPAEAWGRVEGVMLSILDAKGLEVSGARRPGALARLVAGPDQELHRVEQIVKVATNPPHSFLISFHAKAESLSKIMLEMRDSSNIRKGRVSYDIGHGYVFRVLGDVERAGIKPLFGDWSYCWALMSFDTSTIVFNITLLDEAGNAMFSGGRNVGLLISEPKVTCPLTGQ